MRNFKQEGSALCKGMRKGDDKCARILRKNHHGAKQWVPAVGRLAVCASHAPRSLGCTRIFRACSNFFVVFPPSSFFEISFSILWICDSWVLFWNCAVLCLWIFVYIMCGLFYFSGILDIFAPSLLLDW